MASRDSNNATWYLLRYERDFVARTPDPTRPEIPSLGSELFYDPGRHVLELLPEPAGAGVEPPAGLAVDINGEIYQSEPASRRVMKRCCDGTRGELVCERGVFARPAGLALDRRGLLYVADPLAKRVVVVLPDDGSVAGVLVGGLQEPVDVAVSPTGSIYVADRAAGLVVRFNARFERCGDFAARSLTGEPEQPAPIAVMIDADGAVMVADASHPRLLRFDATGRPLPDLELAVAVGSLEGGTVALDALHKAYRRTVPRFLVEACRPPHPSNDGGVRLAEVHRAIRLLSIRLNQRFQACGTYVSSALDAGTPGVTWHKIEIDGDLPPGTWLKIQTATADKPELFTDPDPAKIPVFQPPEDLTSCGALPKAPSHVPDRLVQAPAGRYLRLRLVLGSDGSATPSVRAIRIFYPRISYLGLLPRVYRRDGESARFLEQFLALFEHIFTGVEDRYELFSRQLNPDAAPLEVINWLACLIDLAFDPSWPIARRRALVAAAMELYRRRGTPAGIAQYVEIYTGVRPVILEGFLDRPVRPPLVGVAGSVLGCTTRLTRPDRFAVPDEALVRRFAHRFTVVMPIDDACDEDVLLAVVESIVAANKPAHTIHALQPVHADARVGDARVGLDLMAGSRAAPRTQLGGCPVPGAPPPPPSVLGHDAVLGNRRPGYLRPAGIELS
jgi:phage tail-like protein